MKVQDVWRMKRGALTMVGLCLCASSGCVTESQNLERTDQEQLGLGIVIGTRGYQEIQEELHAPEPFSGIVEGQVVKIEGAAYVVREVTQQERRIPLDQDTTIDRPAHIGDWIAAYLDNRGRAIHVRNIDQEIQEREAPPDVD